MNHSRTSFPAPVVRLGACLAAIAILLGGPPEARAQRATASVAGSILDASQAAVPDATVVVPN